MFLVSVCVCVCVPVCLCVCLCMYVIHLVPELLPLFRLLTVFAVQVSPLAVATSSRVAPTVAGGLSGMSAVTPPVPLAAMGAHAAPPPGYVMVPLAAYQQLTGACMRRVLVCMCNIVCMWSECVRRCCCSVAYL
ncbi:MAG: hypothetical protein P4L40_12255 [Terracidiphilus sp.]|nr:hypothetical protein [Terracidiphilus sp.]